MLCLCLFVWFFCFLFFVFFKKGILIFNYFEFFNFGAAVMAFASIMEGTEEKILPTLGAAMSVLLRLMLSDPALMVRDTAAYAIGVVCDAHSSRIATPEVNKLF